MLTLPVPLTCHYDDFNCWKYIQILTSIICIEFVYFVGFSCNVAAGEKRYIINPPSACSQLGVIADTHHPSYRHSVIDWSDIGQAESRGFDKVKAIDTVVRTGEVLYIPSYWFHYIVSLKYSIQCNSRSGTPPKQNGYDYIKRCMRFNR